MLLGALPFIKAADMRLKKIIPLSLLALTAFGAAAEEFDSVAPPRILSRWEAGVRAGYVFNSNPVFMERMEEGGNVTHSALNAHFRYSFERPRSGRTSSVYQGIGLSVNSFMQPKEIGTPVGLYLFQGAPVVAMTERLSLDYEWNFGATFGWKKTTSGYAVKSNLVVGSVVNAYLNLGFKLTYRLSSGVRLSAGLDLTHYSNGNTSWPNPGVNTIGGAVGLTFVPGADMLRPVSPFTSDSDFKKGISYDVMAYGAWRKAYFPAKDGAFTEAGEKALLPGRYGVAGLTFAPMLDILPVFRAGLSADFQWSENIGKNRVGVPDTAPAAERFCRESFINQSSLGLSARAELVMPFFSINAGIGYGILGAAETKKLYQVVTLKTYIAGPVYLNVGYRMVEFHSPYNLMLGVGVTLGR